MDIISYALSKGNTQKAVTDYLDEHLTNPTNPPIDTSFSIAGAAADSKATGDKLSELKEDLNAVSDDVDALKTTVRDDYTHPELEWAEGSRLIISVFARAVRREEGERGA